MLHLIWVALLAFSVAAAGAQGQVAGITAAAAEAARGAVDTAIGLAGMLALWMGLTRIAERCGLMQALARALGPLLRPLFPSIPRGDPALGAIAMAVSANLLGLGNAATPLALKAMAELKRLSPSDTASPAMITFMVLNSSSPTLIPGTLIALRAAHGSLHPTDILIPTFLATLCAAAAGLAVDAWCRRKAGPPG